MKKLVEVIKNLVEKMEPYQMLKAELAECKGHREMWKLKHDEANEECERLYTECEKLFKETLKLQEAEQRAEQTDMQGYKRGFQEAEGMYKDKAEKWRKWESTFFPEQLDSILSMLEVIKPARVVDVGFEETRPATAEDVKELLIAILGSEDCDIYHVASTMSFKLQSGEILRIKEKK